MALPDNRKRSGSFSGEEDVQFLITSLSHTQPEHIYAVLQRIENLAGDESRVETAVDSILTSAYTADRNVQSLLARLLLKIASKIGKRLPIYDMVSKKCQVLPPMTDTSLSEFLSALPFLDDIYRLNLLNGQTFQIFANWIMKQQGNLPKKASLFLYENLRIVDKLLADRLYHNLDSHELFLWKSCCGRIQHLHRSVDEPKATEILEFLKRLKNEKYWSRRQPLKKEAPRISGNERRSSESLLGKMHEYISELVKCPQQMESVSNVIARSLQNGTWATARDTVFAIMTVAIELSAMELPIVIQLLQNLQKLCSFKDENGKTLKTSTLVAGWAMRLRHFENVDDVVKFCRYLPLINAIFNQKLVISGLFKYYASEVANNEDEVSMLALYEVLLNVDKLADAKVWKYKEDEAAFFEECCCSLGMACQTNTIKDPLKAREISQFLAAIPQKGGWHRAGIARYLEKNQNKTPQPAATSVQNEPQVEESESGDDEDVILVATDLANNEESTLDEGFVEEKPVVNEVLDPEPKPVEETPLPEVTPDPEEEICRILKSLAESPENWPTFASELETLLRSLASKRALNSCAKQIWKEISNAAPETLPVFVHVLDVIQSVAITTKKGGEYSLQKAFTRHAKELRKCQKMKHIVGFCANLRVATELVRLNLVKLDLFRHFVEVVEAESSDKVVKWLFIYEIVRNVDQIVDAMPFEDEDRAFWSKMSSRLEKACRKHLANHDRAEEIGKFLEEIEKKGGWFRKVKPSRKRKHSVVVEDTTETAVTHASFCAFLETDFLKGADGIMATLRFFKSLLLSLASPVLFAEAVEAILDRLFELNEDRNAVELAVKLCSELCQVKNEGGKTFVAALQETCVKLFSQKHRQEADQSVLKLVHEIESTGSPQEQMILIEKMDRLESSIKRKYSGCALLIARLFAEKLVPFNFFLSFVDCLLSIRTDDMIETLLEVLSIAGKKFEHEARVENCMEMWWTNFFNELAQIAQLFDSSPKKKSIVSEILLIKSNDWPSITPEEFAARRLKFMMLELTPSLTRYSLKYSATVNRVKSFLNNCSSSEFSRPLFDVLFTEFQNVLMDLAQAQQQVAQQQVQLAPISLSYQYPPPNNSPWLLPPMTMYSSPNIMNDSVVKLQPNGGGEGSLAARVVSITSLPYSAS